MNEIITKNNQDAILFDSVNMVDGLTLLDENATTMIKGYSMALTSLMAYNNALRRFNSYLIENDKIELFSSNGKIDLMAFKNVLRAYLSNLPLNSAMIVKNACKHSLYKTFNRNEGMKLVIDSLLRQIKIGRVIPSIADRKLTKNQVAELITNASPNLSIIIKTLYMTGIRITELTTIKKSRVKKDGTAYRIKVKGKGNKEREVMITDDVYQEILEEYPLTDDTDLLFYGNKTYRNFKGKDGKLKRVLEPCRPFQMKTNAINFKLKHLGNRILNRRLSAHDFRHSFATHKVNDGKILKAVSRYLGHASTSITNDYYVDATLSDDDLLDKDFANLKGRKNKVGRKRKKPIRKQVPVKKKSFLGITLGKARRNRKWKHQKS